MSKKRKTHDEWPQFSGVACERIRRLTKAKLALERRRDQAFADRDATKAELDAIKKDSPGETRLLADYARYLILIQKTTADLRQIGKQIDEAVLHADQGELFPDPDTFIGAAGGGDPDDPDDPDDQEVD